MNEVSISPALGNPCLILLSPLLGTADFHASRTKLMLKMGSAYTWDVHHWLAKHNFLQPEGLETITQTRWPRDNNTVILHEREILQSRKGHIHLLPPDSPQAEGLIYSPSPLSSAASAAGAPAQRSQWPREGSSSYLTLDGTVRKVSDFWASPCRHRAGDTQSYPKLTPRINMGRMFPLPALHSPLSSHWTQGCRFPTGFHPDI